MLSLVNRLGIVSTEVFDFLMIWELHNGWIFFYFPFGSDLLEMLVCEQTIL